MQVRERRDDFAGAGFGLVAVGFSPPAALAPIADHLEWLDPFCSDTDRTLYRRLDLGRAATRHVFNARTLAIYRDAIGRGERIRAPVEDIRQLGGDVLVVDGIARAVARPRTPDDRPSVDELLRVARSLAAPA